MNVSEIEDTRTTPILLDQCLFGYSDGHRLLASSSSLLDSEESTLLLNSDLISSSIDDIGYWTGLPLLSTKRFALLRTWPAPEMPRPGCVWTHVLLIGFADIARVPELAEVARLARRPSGLSDTAIFTEKLRLHPSLAVPPVYREFRGSMLIELLTSVYGTDEPIRLRGSSQEWEPYVFRLWTQQWPRLRRSFSFRTASSSSTRSQGSARFDLVIAGESDFDPSDNRRLFPEGARGALDWAMEDFHSPSATPFRQFIWRYGADVRRGRTKFLALGGIYEMVSKGFDDPGSFTRALGAVLQAFPDSSEAKLLKSDFLSFGRNQFSLVPAGDPVEALSFYLDSETSSALPELPATVLSSPDPAWRARVPQILAVTEQALEREVPIASALVRTAATIIDRDTFFEATRGFPRVRRELVAGDPELLRSSDLASIPQQEILEILELLPEDEELATALICQLLTVDSREISRVITIRFPRAVVDAVFEGLSDYVANGGPAISESWIHAIHLAIENPSPERLLAMVDRTSQLAACAMICRYQVDVGARAGTATWATVLEHAYDDVQDQHRQNLRCYLLALAIAKPAKRVEKLFEFGFEQIHAAFWSTNLPYESRSIIEPHLPDISWWSQWDMCRRLRIGTARAYVSAGLSARSFSSLSSDRYILRELAYEARELPGGKRYS